MRPSLPAIVFAGLTHTACASQLSGDPLALVPGGTVLSQQRDEARVQTPGGTVVELEFRGNHLDEASGHAPGRGDILVPGGGLLSLDELLAMVPTTNAIIESWSLDTEGAAGWIYELDSIEAGVERERRFSAVDGVELHHASNH